MDEGKASGLLQEFCIVDICYLGPISSAYYKQRIGGLQKLGILWFCQACFMG